MALTCNFWRFSKKENSTITPDADPGLSLAVTLLDSCSVVNPTLVINTTATGDVYQYNYCQLSIFGRYYFIVDWTFDGGLWYAACRVDALASWKPQILATQAYIMRSTYDSEGQILFNTYVGDSKYPVTAAQASYAAQSVVNPFTQVDGVYIVGIVNSESNNGAVTYYTFNKIGFAAFCRALFDYSTGWLDIDTQEISEDLQKALVNPFQYVVSCLYLPINVTDVSSLPGTTGTTTIRFGWWDVTVAQGARIVDTTTSIRKTTSLNIPRHPLAATRGEYLNLSPYSLYTLRYYPFGTINIDSEAIAGWNTLDLYADLDLCTGKGILNIAVNGFGNPFRTIEAQVGVPIPTASLQTNFSNIATGRTAAAAAGATLVGTLNSPQGDKPNSTHYNNNSGGFLQRLGSTAKRMWSDLKEDTQRIASNIQEQGGIKQIASDIFNVAVAASTTAEIQGMQGNASAYNDQTLTLSGRFLPIPEEDFDHLGRPLMQLKYLSSLSGFVLCQEADIAFPCTERERSTIKAYLEGGFFIE